MEQLSLRQTLQATRVGHKAIYLSGGGIANASYGLPDLGMTMIEDVCIDVEELLLFVTLH